MGAFIKTALVFVGGMTAGGCCVVNAALRSETFRAAVKDAVAEKVVYGTERNHPKRIARKVSYKSMYDTPHQPERVDRCLTSCDDLFFATRKDADNTLAAMAEIVEQYGVVSVAEVYEIAQIDSFSYAAKKYGWSSVDCAKVLRDRWGYFIKLPKAVEIK